MAKSSNKKKKYIIFISAIAVIIVAIAIITQVIIPNQKKEAANKEKYQKAMSLAKEGSALDAITILNELGDYSDSQAQIVSLQKQIEQKKTDDAISYAISHFSAYNISYTTMNNARNSFQKLTGSEIKEIFPGKWAARYAYEDSYEETVLPDGTGYQIGLSFGDKFNKVWKVDGDTLYWGSDDNSLVQYEVRKIKDRFYVLYKDEGADVVIIKKDY